MKIVYLATGAANMYCGSCMRDNTLVSAMRSMGLDVTLIPMYTPMRVDEVSASEARVFYGGLEAYVLQQFPKPSLIRNMALSLASRQSLLRLMTQVDIGSAVDPKQNAELTISMLRGEAGHQASLLAELVDHLESKIKPDVVHITNCLVSGAARELKRRLNVPVVCGMHGEDIFLDGLPEPYRTQATELIRQNAESIDQFIAISQYYREYFSQRVGIDPAKVSLVRPGVNLRDYPARAAVNGPANPGKPLTIGYLARVAPEKGLHVLVDAYIRLCQSGEFPGLRLRVAGYSSRAYRGYVRRIREALRKAGLSGRVDMLGTVNREEKLEFLSSLDVFSVPTIYRDPKGLPVLEALACGTPVVQPEHGAFPELVQATGGGLLHHPDDAADLAEKLAQLLRDPALRAKMSISGQVEVRRYFSADRMAVETAQVYQEVLHGKARLPASIKTYTPVMKRVGFNPA